MLLQHSFCTSYVWEVTNTEVNNVSVVAYFVVFLAQKFDQAYILTLRVKYKLRWISILSSMKLIGRRYDKVILFADNYFIGP